jgi:hypothetical protein
MPAFSRGLPEGTIFSTERTRISCCAVLTAATCANSELASQVVESEALSSDRRVLLDNGANPKTGKSSHVGAIMPAGLLTYARIGARRSSVEPPNFNTEDLMP